jgi:muramoyltetrapeptide carboxypeptidase
MSGAGPLAAGDHVRVVAPAGPVDTDLLDAGVALLRDWDLDVSVAPHVTATHRLGYLAGGDADRAADLAQAWCDPQVAAVFCARGGYGSQRVLPHLDWAALADAAPKPLVGSSDVTALHHEFAAHLGVPTVFGPMVASEAFAKDKSAQQSLHRALFQPTTSVVVSGPDAGPLVGGRVRGITAGGTASLLAALAGASTPPPPGCVLLLEDVGESPYRLDRIVTQLLAAGWLREVAGIALGSFIRCGSDTEVWAVLADRLMGLGVPVAWGLTFGHCRGQATIRLGAPAVLDADAGELTI